MQCRARNHRNRCSHRLRKTYPMPINEILLPVSECLIIMLTAGTLPAFIFSLYLRRHGGTDPYQFADFFACHQR